MSSASAETTSSLRANIKRRKEFGKKVVESVETTENKNNALSLSRTEKEVKTSLNVIAREMR
ncbi:MAG: hypothetical protein ACLFTA_01815 [Candidatus Nanohaloarchaea archaeon]